MAYCKVNKLTEELAEDFIGYKLGKNTEIPNNLTAKTLRRLAADLEREHGDLFKNMLKSLRSPHTGETVFLKIAKEMFTDQIINWGRIAVLYTFAGHMAVYCEKNRMKTESENVACWVSSFVKSNMTDWIVKNGGWVCILIVASLVDLVEPVVLVYLLKRLSLCID